MASPCPGPALEDTGGALASLPAGHRFWVRRVDEGPDASSEALLVLRAAGLVPGIHGRVVTVDHEGAVTVACAGRVSVLSPAAAARVTVVAGSIDDVTP